MNQKLGLNFDRRFSMEKNQPQQPPFFEDDLYLYTINSVKIELYTTDSVKLEPQNSNTE